MNNRNLLLIAVFATIEKIQACITWLMAFRYRQTKQNHRETLMDVDKIRASKVIFTKAQRESMINSNQLANPDPEKSSMMRTITPELQQILDHGEWLDQIANCR